VVVSVALTIDLTLTHLGSGRVSLKRALAETALWVCLATGFGVWMYVSRGRQSGIEFFTAYLVEKSLSADNVFVFLLIFRTFGIEAQFQHRVLYTGVVGALVLRLVFVLAGVQLLRHFHFTIYIFGTGLLILGLHMLVFTPAFRPEQSWLVRLVRRIHPVDSSYKGHRFWARNSGRLTATPLLLALVAIEAMDVIFAADSVPAVLAITRDPFIAYSSNIFAILGLRAMYFGLAELMARMRFLHQGLSVILMFVGAKMLVNEWIPIPALISLALIITVLIVAGLASWLWPSKMP
jgi:tellurite resistance protein TerC